MKILVATRNPGKEREIRDLFTSLPFQVVFPADQFLERLPEEADLERGTSFVENAVAKARYFAKRSGLPTLADDSGLEVDALHGLPGVHSARFAALYGDRAAIKGDPDAANNALLLQRLEGMPEEQRSARYRCVVAYLESPHAAPQMVEATCEGRILTAPEEGKGGFGYDPLFWSPELGASFADAPLAAKQRVSHRGRALRALIEVLVRRLG
ncbi:MAG TPA: RdgB/HAM1 family non-canonical purine NTP pyrophosphatase [Gemmatimonadales bacterium]|nr:RdgB/HAM1 family non-canonical purine NTP pyrophosphatase [Gemmatimonadales bacterium]